MLNVIPSLVASGGSAPVEALPEACCAYPEWLSIRYAVDGMSSLLFYERLPEAGLAEAVRFLGACLVAVLAGYVAAASRTLLSLRRSSDKTRPEEVPG